MVFMNKEIVFVLIGLCLCFVNSQRPGFGKCPPYQPVDNFDIKKFEGTWYEVERSFYLLELASGCTTLNFTAMPSGIFRVAMRTANKWNGNILLNVHGTASPTRGNDKGALMFRFNMNLPYALERVLPGVGHYTILGTDYDNYAVLYSCSNMGILHADLLWVLSRKIELPVTSRVQVYDVLNVLNIDPARLTLTNHRSCPKF
uniref:Lipocalin/cytosolic fatty-acid binding domain-containing protein n=1 Tax=Clastoptera arizonana TaxID=38151 RepID=A0A1B6ECX3_9HEMI